MDDGVDIDVGEAHWRCTKSRNNFGARTVSSSMVCSIKKESAEVEAAAGA